VQNKPRIKYKKLKPPFAKFKAIPADKAICNIMAQNNLYKFSTFTVPEKALYSS